MGNQARAGRWRTCRPSRRIPPDGEINRAPAAGGNVGRKVGSRPMGEPGASTGGGYVDWSVGLRPMRKSGARGDGR